MPNPLNILRPKKIACYVTPVSSKPPGTNRALDGGTPVPVLGGDETLPKKRPNSVAEKSTLKKKQHANGGESTKHTEFTIQEKLNFLEELGVN